MSDLQHGDGISFWKQILASCFLIYLPLNQIVKNGADWHRLLPGESICRESPPMKKKEGEKKNKWSKASNIEKASTQIGCDRDFLVKVPRISRPVKMFSAKEKFSKRTP